MSKCGQDYSKAFRPMQGRISRQRLDIWRKAQGFCWYCGKIMPLKSKRWAIDHIVPGKDNSYCNLVPTCQPCNSTKNNRTVEDLRWHLQRKMFGLPAFSKQQREFLSIQQFSFPGDGSVQFWFERHNMSPCFVREDALTDEEKTVLDPFS